MKGRGVLEMRKKQLPVDPVSQHQRSLCGNTLGERPDLRGVERCFMWEGWTPEPVTSAKVSMICE